MMSSPASSTPSITSSTTSSATPSPFVSVELFTFPDFLVVSFLSVLFVVVSVVISFVVSTVSFIDSFISSFAASLFPQPTNPTIESIITNAKYFLILFIITSIKVFTSFIMNTFTKIIKIYKKIEII